MSGALAVFGTCVAAAATGSTGVASVGRDDCCGSPSVLTTVGSDGETRFESSGKNIIKPMTTTAMPATDAMAHFTIDDFDFLLEAACGADSWTCAGGGGGAAIAGTAKLALQAGHSMV